MVLECVDLCLVWYYVGWDGLLGFAVDKLAEVEGSSHTGKFLLVTGTLSQG